MASSDQTKSLVVGLLAMVAGVFTVVVAFYGLVSAPDTPQQDPATAPKVLPEKQDTDPDDPDSQLQQVKPPQVKSTTCLIEEARTSEAKTSTAKSPELIVVLSVPPNSQECHDTMTIDAPTFGLGKKATQPVDIIPPPKSDEARWVLEPEKPGTWSIAVETEDDRELVPVSVTTAAGFPARWVEIGTIAGAAITITLGVLTLYLRRGE